MTTKLRVKSVVEVKKVWGGEKIIANHDKYCGKILYINPGFLSSLHYHPKKHETFYVLEGRVALQVGPHLDDINRQISGQLETFELSAGDVFELPPDTPHRFWALPETIKGTPPITVNAGAKIIEISTFHSDEDVVRVENSKKIDD